MSDAAALAAALAAADTVPVIIEALARATWANAHNGAKCPDDEIPTLESLTGWLSECPADAVQEACVRLSETMRRPAVWWWFNVIGADGSRMPIAPPLASFRDLSELEPIGRRSHPSGRSPRITIGPEHAAELLEVAQRSLTGPNDVGSSPPPGPNDAGSPLSAVLAAWREFQPVADRPRHPLAPLVAAWQGRPREVEPNIRPDRIIPSQIAMFAAREGDARGRLFSPLRSGDKGGQIPLFVGREHDITTPALPLALYELGVNRTSPGTGAPLALRLFVEAILAVELDDRDIDRAVTFALPMRNALARLFPKRPPRPNEWRPAIAAARRALAADEAGIPWPGGTRWAVTITNLPEHLDDVLKLVVDLPPGAKHGPQVSPRLHLYGPKQGRHYRALLNLAYWWHEPGRTLVPARRGGHWLQVQDPKRYRTPTDTELVNIVFPATASRAIRARVADAHKVIADLESRGELRIIGPKLLPPKPE